MVNRWRFDFTRWDEFDILILNGDTDAMPLIELMSRVSQVVAKSPFDDQIDWKDRYGWTMLSNLEIQELMTAFQAAANAL